MEDGGGGGGGGGKNDKGDVTYEVCDCQYISVRGNLTFGAGNVSCLLTLADVADWNLGSIPKGILGFGINVSFTLIHWGLILYLLEFWFVLLVCKLFEYGIYP